MRTTRLPISLSLAAFMAATAGVAAQAASLDHTPLAPAERRRESGSEERLRRAAEKREARRTKRLRIAR